MGKQHILLHQFTWKILTDFLDMLDTFILSFSITSWSENNQTLIKPISRADYVSKDWAV